VIAWIPLTLVAFSGPGSRRCGRSASRLQRAFGAAFGAAFRAHPADVHATIMVTDRLSRLVPIRKWTTAIGYSATSPVFLGIGFSTPPGGAQLLLLAVGVFFAAGTSGPAGAMVVNLTAEPIRATSLGKEETAVADEEDVAVGVAMVTLFGTVAMVLLPLLWHPFGLSDAQFGVWAGASIQEVGQVVAAAGAGGRPAER
jgi:hypothetical protein